MKLSRLIVPVMLISIALAGCKLKEQTAGEPGQVPAPSDVAAPPANALKTPSGLASKVLTVGLGRVHPTENSLVTVHYTGWTADGKMFETTMGRQPVSFQAGQVIDGWKEGLKLMVAGEKRRFWIPGNLAYDNIPDPAAPKGMLCFEIELID